MEFGLFVLAVYLVFAILFGLKKLAPKKERDAGGSGGGGAAPEGEWPPASPARSDYSHHYDGTAIAVDREGEIVHLRGIFNKIRVEKSYPFAAIRSWNTNVSSGGLITSHGKTSFTESLGMGIANHRKIKENERKSGLFIQVRDIDHPEWRVAFPSDTSDFKVDFADALMGRPNSGRHDLELKRWMEIMRQFVGGD